MSRPPILLSLHTKLIFIRNYIQQYKTNTKIIKSLVIFLEIITRYLPRNESIQIIIIPVINVMKKYSYNTKTSVKTNLIFVQGRLLSELEDILIGISIITSNSTAQKSVRVIKRIHESHSVRSQLSQQGVELLLTETELGGT